MVRIKIDLKQRLRWWGRYQRDYVNYDRGNVSLALQQFTMPNKGSVNMF